MKVIPKKTFLVRQEDSEGGKKKDIVAKKGVAIEFTEKEAVKFWGSLDLKDVDKKKLLSVAKSAGYKRLV
jgi:hypothetical protein